MSIPPAHLYTIGIMYGKFHLDDLKTVREARHKISPADQPHRHKSV